MIDIRKSLRGKFQEEEINMAPLIDMVFLLLIFFMVTTSFVKETGIDVHRPTASTAQLKKQGAIFCWACQRTGTSFLRKRQSICAACGRTLSAVWRKTRRAPW